MDIGFIGAGAMGVPMIRRLLAAGHKVRVYNRTPHRLHTLVEEGAVSVDSPAAAATSPVTVSMLADDDAVNATVLDAGVLDAMPRGAVHVCMATISVSLAAQMRDAHARHRRGFVSAPVFGRPAAAAAGKLFILAAGTAADLQVAAPVFEAVGQKTFELGADPVAANVVKLCGNLSVAVMNETWGELFALAGAHGVAAQQLVDVLTGSIYPAPIYRLYGDLIAQEAYSPPAFPLRLGLKDAKLALGAADSAHVALPLASLVRDQYLKAVARGWSNLDWAALGQVSREDAVGES
ncbi:NAD(P)-dependent oxidoreductase [Hydrogenophaga sp.]|uniref:NAD(P)-dependent oxidoreductase n=1 Tax=Hydrogenophaga sp. TaxID=1904254 RepID=UPI003D0D2548